MAVGDVMIAQSDYVPARTGLVRNNHSLSLFNRWTRKVKIKSLFEILDAAKYKLYIGL